uniref:(northern house mosquito) hypothetical protein n=1 Tax=Culex pipiens TaxID=7175 RepID=A0A8D8C460_CULPI
MGPLRCTVVRGWAELGCSFRSVSCWSGCSTRACWMCSRRCGYCARSGPPWCRRRINTSSATGPPSSIWARSTTMPIKIIKLTQKKKQTSTAANRKKTREKPQDAI